MKTNLLSMLMNLRGGVGAKMLLWASVAIFMTTANGETNLLGPI